MIRKSHPLLPYLLILPTLVFVLIFTVYPSISSIVGSLYQHRLNIPKYRDPQFFGLGNYRDLFESQQFRLIMSNTVRYVVVLVPAMVVASLFLALWLRKKRFARLRVAIFHPTILPMVSAATIWLFFFTPDYGLFNSFLRLFGYSGPENWIGNPDMALWAMVIVAFWKDTGFYMIFYLAGVQNLPKDVYEALEIEGAGPVTTFFRFTLPLLRRTTLFVTTVAVIGAFRTVDHVFVMTQGGPSERSSLLLYHLWQVRFESLNVGQASAITVILILVLLLFTIANFIFSEGRSKDV
ncbi:carbohydrate ABC transporter permease [Sediminispirochaeta smaragdinae]|uniref:Binding-protein-dependent transport systems inner membrane component n=1 Tax=Sediminispirochaeta smaragdinae (strain DSM 11293 / JCM 15392 / SEBR 4228) TaxID=573413 RepID=E1RBX5_SEDSS|nr:sugar ABC transporter permease [Sediminispirochaeta smaragdinae]ADK79855.1 binding-protein-dependent transport systems inner membrane component [Sediminispirochaeta smaragdinae DSM 11293]